MFKKHFLSKIVLLAFGQKSRPYSFNYSRPKIPFPEKKVLIKTCASKGGVDYQVSCIDTAGGADRSAALLIRGSPGVYRDFCGRIPCLADRSVGVLVPTFPEYSFMHKGSGRYRHNMEDRANFVTDFLKALDISKIDLLAAHSSGVYPSLHMICNMPDKFGALALINPAMHRSCKLTTPLWLYYGIVYAGFYKPSYLFLKKFMFPLLKKLAPVRIENVDHPLMSYTSILTPGFKNIEKLIKTVRQWKKPSLFIYSRNDKSFELDVYKDMLKLLDVKDNQVSIYDDQNKLKNGTDVNNQNWIKAIELETGTHYSIWKRPDIVNEALYQLLARSNYNPIAV